jgi:hypothetical protein
MAADAPGFAMLSIVKIISSQRSILPEGPS